MDDTTLDDLLTTSAPPRRSRDPRVASELQRVVAESRALAGKRPTSPRRAPHRRRRLWWLAVPVLGIPVIGLVTTASTEPRLVPDFTIPIAYTTDTGKQIACSIDFYNGEIDYREQSLTAVAWLEAQDWTGVGQRVYDVALGYENDPAWLGSELNSDHPTDAATIQHRAFLTAQEDVMFAALHDQVMTDGDHYGADSDCTGELH